MRHIIPLIVLLLLTGCGPTRQQQWDQQSGYDRIRSGDNPRNHLPGHGLNRVLRTRRMRSRLNGAAV